MGDANVGLLANHGVLVLAKDIDQAYLRAMSFEWRCKQAWHVAAAGGGTPACSSRWPGASCAGIPRSWTERPSTRGTSMDGNRRVALVMICTGGTTGKPKGVLWRSREFFVTSLRGHELLDAAPEPTLSGATDAALDAHARRSLAGYKVPKRYIAVGRIERLVSGKADYRWAQERATC
jgi:acyl-CoA synthetase (AMP-forming)/AMP-acid ligase II